MTRRRGLNNWAMTAHTYEREAPPDDAKRSLAVALVASLRWLPQDKARDMARLVGLAALYVGEGMTPPFDMLPREGDVS